MRVLVTGASGFIGSAVGRQCEEAGFDVCVRRADLLQFQETQQLLRDAHCVVHCAGLAHGACESESAMNANVKMTENVMRAAAVCHVQHVVMVSSVSVYGPTPPTECKEDQVCAPEDFYSRSKYLSEQAAIDAASREGFTLTILRLATAYGEGDPGNMTRLVQTIDRGIYLRIGSGLNRKSLIHRDDVAAACLAVLTKAGPGIDVYNLGAGSHTTNEIVETIAACLGKKLRKSYVPASVALSGVRVLRRLAPRRFSRIGRAIDKFLTDNTYNFDAFQNAYSYRPQIHLADGIARHVAWYRRQSKS